MQIVRLLNLQGLHQTRKPDVFSIGVFLKIDVCFGGYVFALSFCILVKIYLVNNIDMIYTKDMP
jgi:hypothetical protein